MVENRGGPCMCIMKKGTVLDNEHLLENSMMLCYVCLYYLFALVARTCGELWRLRGRERKKEVFS